MNKVASFQSPSIDLEIQVSSYDRLNAWLLSAILILAVLLLILATVATRQNFVAQDGFEGTGKDLGELLTTSALEIPETSDPEVDAQDLNVSVIDASLFEQITATVSNVRAGGYASTAQHGPGGIPGRQVEPPRELVDRMGHWVVTYELVDQDIYAQQLRHFEIELGVLSRTQNNIWRVSDVGRKNTLTQSDRVAESDATYFTPADARSRRWDRSFVKQADGPLEDVIVVHFYPPAILETMKLVELKTLPSGKSIEDVAETRFRLTRVNDQFQFEVTEFKFK